MIALLAALLAVVNSPYAPPTYACNGIQATFVVAFPYRDQSDLVVVTSAAGTLGLTSDYTVSLASSTTTALLTLNNPAVRCPSGTLKITRVTRPPQKYPFGQQTTFNTKTLEVSEDALAYQIQETADVASSGGGTTVSSSSPITGTGAAANPLSLDRTVAGSWSGAQNFKYVNGTCKIGQFTGADFSAKMNAAFADSSCTGKIFDASDMTGSQSMSQDITILSTAVTVIFPPTEIVMGAHQIIVPVSKHAVTLFGASGSYGTNAGAGQLSTRFNYSGNGVAIVVGDSSADTLSFRAANFLVVTNFGGANAINMQLNRAVDYHLERINFSLASTQWGLDLEGYANQTSGVVDHAKFGGISGNAIYFGKNASANVVIGAHFSMGNVSGTCFNFAGEVTGNATGNHIVGGDCENATNVIVGDYSSHNTSEGLRTENDTNVVNMTANSNFNSFRTKGSQAMAVINAGSNNANTDTYFTQISRNAWLMKNSTDSTSLITLQAGLSADQLIGIRFQGFGGTDWRVEKSSADVFNITHQSTGIVRTQHAASNSFLNSEGGGSVAINNTVNAGTGGLAVYGGGGAPALAWSAAADGLVTMKAKLQAALGTPANGTMYYCSDCNTASAPCTGGGTGALAFRQNGAWKCF